MALLVRLLTFTLIAVLPAYAVSGCSYPRSVKRILTLSAAPPPARRTTIGFARFMGAVERLRANNDDFALEGRRCFATSILARTCAHRLASLSACGRASASARKLLATGDSRPFAPGHLAELRRCEAAIWSYDDFDDETTMLVDKSRRSSELCVPT